MLRVGVLVSGGGTNLQAILDAVKSGKITNAEVVYVMSNNADAYALKRAEKAGVEAECMSPKQFPDRAAFNTAMTRRLIEKKLDLIVLAGFLVTIPPEMIQAFRGRIINIHPSLIPSFCGKGYYGLKVHEKALERGVKVTGATVHVVDEDLDHGPILLQKAALDNELYILLGDGEVLISIVHTEKRICGELELRSGINEFLDTEDHTELGLV